ncbi:LysR family transcriptional regulator [Burkholderia plantarii]|uniref:Transcriptional regulator, LysR family n=1 Tax=Burkholderia plantarii TaxID=41899 RepID=A0A0B6SEX9_BURPL|nr:LysR family transcriptional regulator [Burkholderia plantarii]AJK50776.1 transcriptional regulator, LysR family [Burkholderia plantarii]
MRTNETIGRLPFLATFVRVVELRSFSAAAHSLGQTPSAISRQISRLESELGVRLLVRTTRKLQLSEIGERVYRACEDMMSAAESVSDITGRFIEKPHGLVRASAPLSYGKAVVSPHVTAFLREHPEVNVQLRLTDQEIDLIDDAVDFVIRIGEEPPPNLVAKPLSPVRYVLCASEAYLAGRGRPATPRELAAHDTLFFGDHHADHRWCFRRDGEEQQVTVRGRFVVNHSEAMLDAVRVGAGVGFLPDFTARAALKQNEVVRLFPDWQLITPYSGIAWLLYQPNRHLPPKVRVFIDHLLHAIPEAFSKSRIDDM